MSAFCRYNELVFVSIDWPESFVVVFVISLDCSCPSTSVLCTSTARYPVCQFCQFDSFDFQ